MAVSNTLFSLFPGFPGFPGLPPPLTHGANNLDKDVQAFVLTASYMTCNLVPGRSARLNVIQIPQMAKMPTWVPPSRGS